LPLSQSLLDKAAGAEKALQAEKMRAFQKPESEMGLKKARQGGKKMLIFTLKKEWYEKIKSGEKTVEYREVKPYWERRISNEFIFYIHPSFVGKNVQNVDPRPVKLRLGYTKRYLIALVKKIEIVNGKDTDLHIDKPVYAIHLTNVKEERK
jgi:hypothetical protein